MQADTLRVTHTGEESVIITMSGSRSLSSQFLKNGECIFSVDLTKRGLLCSAPLRPWYSVYGDWDCKVRQELGDSPVSSDISFQRTYLSLPFGLISNKTTPQDPVWADCRQI